MVAIHFNRRLSDEKEVEIARHYKEGMPLEELRAKFNLRRKLLDNCLARRGVERREFRRKRWLNERAFDIQSEERDYFVGLLATDGNVYMGRGGQADISISFQEQDGYMIERLREFVGSTSKIFVRRPKNQNAQPQHRLMFTSQYIADRIATFGIIPRKSLVCRIAGGIETSRHFWRGVVDGNGCLSYNKGYPVLHLSGSDAIIDQFREFSVEVMNRHDDVKFPNRSKIGPISQFSIQGEKAVQLVSIIYRGAKISLLRKQQIADAMMGAQAST